MLFPVIGIAGVGNFSSSIIVIMEHKRATSKDTTKRSNGEEVESTLVYIPVYSDTQMFMEEESILHGRR